jgi:hypothetical protein
MDRFDYAFTGPTHNAHANTDNLDAIDTPLRRGVAGAPKVVPVCACQHGSTSLTRRGQPSQIQGDRMDNKGPGPGGLPPKGPMPSTQPLTDAQKGNVKELFQKYDVKKLTSADLKTIMDSLEKSGIHGPAFGEAMKLAGLDEETSLKLMPKPPHDGKVPPPPGGRMPPPPPRKDKE